MRFAVVMANKRKYALYMALRRDLYPSSRESIFSCSHLVKTRSSM
jgi:hypothetical protein